MLSGPRRAQVRKSSIVADSLIRLTGKRSLGHQINVSEIPSFYPSPITGPPIPPAPHLLPYLYPSGLYPPPPLSLLHNNPGVGGAGLPPTGLNPGLLFNAQLALAAQHPALFSHYATGHGPMSPMQGLKGHRFSPYNLPGLGSAFEAVTPGSNNSVSVGNRSLSTSPRARPPSSSPTTSTRPLSVSPVNQHSPVSQQQPTPLNSPPPTQVQSSQNNNNNNSSSRLQSTPSELKSIEKMVNGLEVQHTAAAGVVANGSGEDKASGAQ